MEFIIWLTAHGLSLAGFICIYIIANRLLCQLNKWTKKVCHVLLFASIAFYVFGYLTPINPFTMIAFAYLTVLICLAIQKYNIIKLKENSL